jgi:hypothetical protein
MTAHSIARGQIWRDTIGEYGDRRIVWFFPRYTLVSVILDDKSSWSEPLFRQRFRLMNDVFEVSEPEPRRCACACHERTAERVGDRS